MLIFLKKVFILSIFLFLISSLLTAQENYALYTAKGKEMSFKELVQQVSGKDIVLFGELHNDKTLHELQLKLTQHLAKDQRLMLGAEMLERHDQKVIDEYLQGIIDTSQLFNEATLWPNFKSDYLPLLAFAKRESIPFIATNIPRPLAKVAAFKNIAYLDSICTDSMRNLMVPFPFILPEKAVPYKELIKSDFGASHNMDTKKIVAAQALKDATMAHSILKNREAGYLFVHYHGDFHSKDFGGITHWLKTADKKLNVSVISSVEADDLSFQKDWKKQGDVIIVVKKSGPKSY